MRNIAMEKDGSNIIIKSVDIEAMKQKGWTVVITDTDTLKKKRKKKTTNEFKPTIGEIENGHT